MRVPANDLGAAYRALKTEIDAAIHRVLDSGWYILGQEVKRFEEEFARATGAPHGIGVGSGTEALHLALAAMGVGRGDFVFTVSHTATATVAAIEMLGAIPVLVDVEAESQTMDPESLGARIADAEAGRLGPGAPRAVLPVHLYGQPADLGRILPLAKQHGLLVLEDCAQAHGALWQGRPVGSFGDAAAFSFYPTKNLGALGDAGAVVTADARIAESARLLRQYGWADRYVSQVPGWNTRLDELQAAVLRVKLAHLDSANSRRRAIAQRYTKALTGTRVVPPAIREGAEHVFHLYVVQLDGRDAAREAMTRAGVGTLIHYPLANHQQPAYRDRLPGHDRLPVTERLVSRILSLPMYPELTDEQVGWVIDALLGAL